jgi:hypothetical protein
MVEQFGLVTIAPGHPFTRRSANHEVIGVDFRNQQRHGGSMRKFRALLTTM